MDEEKVLLGNIPGVRSILFRDTGKVQMVDLQLWSDGSITWKRR